MEWRKVASECDRNDCVERERETGDERGEISLGFFGCGKG